MDKWWKRNGNHTLVHQFTKSTYSLLKRRSDFPWDSGACRSVRFWSGSPSVRYCKARQKRRCALKSPACKAHRGNHGKFYSKDIQKRSETQQRLLIRISSWSLTSCTYNTHSHLSIICTHFTACFQYCLHVLFFLPILTGFTSLWTSKNLRNKLWLWFCPSLRTHATQYSLQGHFISKREERLQTLKLYHALWRYYQSH